MFHKEPSRYSVRFNLVSGSFKTNIFSYLKIVLQIIISSQNPSFNHFNWENVYYICCFMDLIFCKITKTVVILLFHSCIFI